MLTIDKYAVLANQSPQTGATSGKAGDVQFQATLLGLLQKTQSPEDAGRAGVAPDKERLMLLSKALQIQMNRQLLNSVLGDALEVNALASQLLSDMKMPVAASNNEHHPSTTGKLAPDSAIENVIAKASSIYGLDPDLIRSVIRVESDFNPGATSPKGAMGLMQLMPDTARELGVRSPYDPEENVMGGARYLKSLLDRYDGQVDMALAAYNWGMGNLERNPDRLPFETAGYIDRVSRLYREAKS
ncbi:MAG: lytic transglycosylase domain-containing protein [Smithellaceae bacterium]